MSEARVMRLRIDKGVYGGACISAEAPGVAVPFTLPGEVVEVDRSVSGVELVSVMEASPQRVVPRCPHFGACGGCQYQHADYAMQVTLKQEILRDTLEAAGLRGLPAIQVHTGEPWGYRNRIRLRVGLVEGVLRVGYNRRGSYEMLPIRECPIASPLLLRGAEAALAIAGVPAMAAWGRQLVEVELFTTGDQSLVQMTLALRSERGCDLAGFCLRVKALLPELAGAGVVVVGSSGRKEQPGARWGADGLRYRATDRDYWVSQGSFFQVNRFLVDELVRLVTAGHSGTLAWDLYAGVGLFSRPLAEAFAKVVGVETVVGDLGGVLRGNGKRAVGTTVAEFLRGAVLQRERPELIVMDPPRAGVGEEVCALLARVKAPAMVYVSCDPETLARDLKAMVDSGYTIREAHLVDLFPQTFHLETVVMLHR